MSIKQLVSRNCRRKVNHGQCAFLSLFPIYNEQQSDLSLPWHLLRAVMSNCKVFEPPAGSFTSADADSRHFQFRWKDNFQCSGNRMGISICNINIELIIISMCFEIDPAAKILLKKNTVEQQQFQCIAVQSRSHHFSVSKHSHFTPFHNGFPHKLF